MTLQVKLALFMILGGTDTHRPINQQNKYVHVNPHIASKTNVFVVATTTQQSS
jgi:hypothetical protein